MSAGSCLFQRAIYDREGRIEEEGRVTMYRDSVLLLALAACALGLNLTGNACAEDKANRLYTLENILALAMDRSPTLAGAEGAVRQSRGQQIAAGAYPNPIVSGVVGRGAIRDPSNGVRLTERTITVEQPLEWTGTRRARQQAADAAVAGASAALEETRLTIVSEGKIAFYQLLLAQRDAELALQNLTSVEEVLRTVKLRVAAGEATSFETMKATVEVQKATKEIGRTQSMIIVARARLNRLTAGALGKDFSIQGNFETFRQEFDLEEVMVRALERHPSMRRWVMQTEQADHHLTFERESRIPNVIVQAQYHREAGDESVTGGLSIPVPLWYQRQGEIESALGAKYRAEAERRRAESELQQAITQHLQEISTASDQIRVFENGLLKQAEQTLSVARTSFRQGAASLLDVLDAQRIQRQTLLEYAQAQADLSISLARFERSIGGTL
jgi:cobalt-zinc-cadmium efflux system outer membrane protein